MVNYRNGKIYKIVCNITDECYIGSTCEPTLAMRMSKHVGDFKMWKAGKKNRISSFDIIERGNYNIYLIESFPCNSKDELRAREGTTIRQYKSNYECTNKNIAGRTSKEYEIDRRETKKEYREINKERIHAQGKIYRENNKDKIKEKGKKYHEANKDKIKEKNKKYNEDNTNTIKRWYEKNKEKLSAKSKEKNVCVCGSCFRKAERARHERTNKHQDYLKSFE